MPWRVSDVSSPHGGSGSSEEGARLHVGVVVTSTEHGGAEAHIARLWTDPLVAARAQGHLLGDLPQWHRTGLPATDIGTGAKWSYRRAVRSLAATPVVIARGRRRIREAHGTRAFDAFYAHFKREQVVHTRSLSRIAPVVWMEHGALPAGRLRRPLMEAYRRAAAEVCAIVCLSEAVRGEIADVLGPDAPEMVVIPNAIDPAWTRPASDGERAAARRALGIPEDAELVVAIVARLIPRKRIADSIRAAACLPSCWMVICGDGPLDAELRALAAGNPQVVFTGFRLDPRPVYAAADVSLLASWEEGFGQVLLEAASAGLPCVVVDDSGLSPMVAGWGAAASAPTGEAIAEALLLAATRSRAGARAWAEAHGPEGWARAHLEVLERAVRRRGSTRGVIG